MLAWTGCVAVCLDWRRAPHTAAEVVARWVTEVLGGAPLRGRGRGTLGPVCDVSRRERVLEVVGLADRDIASLHSGAIVITG